MYWVGRVSHCLPRSTSIENFISCHFRDSYLLLAHPNFKCTLHFVSKVILLQAAEFSGYYESSHKNIFGLSVVLELKAKN